jgi:adenosylcobinamide-GDP ribazoletransferase
VSGLIVALRYLTIVPLPGNRPHERSAPGRAAAWFPVIGAGIGLTLVVTDRLTGALFPSLLAALLTVTMWKLVTGGLHLDGLADCLDGLPGVDAGQRLRIMRDSRIGAFGAIGLILFLLLEIAALSELGAAVRWRALLAAPAIARAMPPLLSRVFPPARSEGQAFGFRQGVDARGVVLALGGAVVVAILALGVIGLVALLAVLLVTAGLGQFFTRHLGGVTGDVLGAAVEAAELTTLLTVSAWSHAGH